MPKDKIEYAILRGCGEVPGMVYEEKVYEGYGPGGIAIICDILTDSINRTASEIKHIFSKNGGNMGEPGCVSWDFKKVGFMVAFQFFKTKPQFLILIAWLIQPMKLTLIHLVNLQDYLTKMAKKFMKAMF